MRRPSMQSDVRMIGTRRCRERVLRSVAVLLCVAVLFAAGSSLASAAIGPVQTSMGTRYLMQATDVTLTTRQVEAFSRSGSLAQEIAERAHLLVRVLPLRELYEGSVELVDVASLQDAASLTQTATYPLTFIVNPAAASEGAITITVTVVATPPAQTSTPPLKPVSFTLFQKPAPPRDPGTDTPTGPPTGTPTGSGSQPSPTAGGGAQDQTDASRTTPARTSRTDTPATDTGSEQTTGSSPSASTMTPMPDSRSLLQRLLSTINQYGAEGWMALGLETVTFLGIVPAFTYSISGDIRVLRWHGQKKAQCRLAQINALT